MANSTVEKLTPTRVKLSITVTPEDLKPSIAHAYEHIAQDVQIPGFRKGKVPAPIIDQRIGRGAVIEHAVNEGLDKFFREATTEHKLRIVGRPAAEITQWPNEKDFSGDLLVDIEVDVRPEIELPDYAGVTLTVDAVEADEAALDAELDNMRARFGTLIPVDRPAAKGDFVELDLVATIDGAEMVAFEDLEVGDCLPYVDYTGEDTIFELPVVPCDQPHTDEVYFIYEVDDQTFPGESALLDEAWDGCLAQFEGFVGVPYEQSELDFSSYQPTKASWTRAGDRAIQCIAYSYDDVTGTLRGAAR